MTANPFPHKPDTRKRQRVLPIVLVLVLVSSAMAIAPAATADGAVDGGAGSTEVDSTMDPEAVLDDTGIYFEPNLGQFPDHVRFVVRGAGMHAFLTDEGVTFVLSEAVETEENQTTEPSMDHFEQESPERREHAVLLEYADANPTPVPSGQDILPGISNHFKGNDPTKWVTNVPHYERVTQHDVWPGIDLEWYGQEGKGLKFDAIVHPGANPGQVQFTVDGAEDVHVDGEGRLVMETPLGDLVKDVPYTYQEAGRGGVEDVSTHYDLSSDVVAFAIDEYDESKTLVIDPLFFGYSTYLGGSSTDYGWGVAVDSSGNAIVTGYTRSTDYPTTSGAYQTSKASYADVFVTKLSADGGSLVYSTYLGGSSKDFGWGVAVDSSSNAIVTGSTESTDYPTTLGAYQTSHAGGTRDVFVTKLTSGGSLGYSTYLGGSEWDEGHGVAVDSDGNAIVTGYTESTDYPTTLGAYQTSHAGGIYDVFVTKLSANGGSLVYSTLLGGDSWEQGKDVAVDSSGNAYVTGVTASWSYPTTSGAYQTSHSSGGFDSDVFVTKLTSGGSLAYSTYLGGSDSDLGRGVAVDSSGNAYVTGSTQSTDYPTTPGAIQSNNAGNEDVFVTKLSTTGWSLAYSTLLGGSDDDYGWGVAVDSDGNAIVTGYTESTDYPTTLGAYQTSYAGGTRDVFVTKLSPTGGSLGYSTYLGSNDLDAGLGVAVDSSGNAIVTGYTRSTDYPTTLGAYRTSYAGGTRDVFVTKVMTDDDPPTISGAPQSWSWQDSIPTLSGVSWHDPVSGLRNNVEYSIGTSSGGTDVVAWTTLPTQPSNGRTTSWDPAWSPSTLAQGTNYVNVRLEDRAGNTVTTEGAYVVDYDSVTETISPAPWARTGAGGALIPEDTWQTDNTPRFEWDAPASTAPLGYSYTLSTSSASLPDSGVDTTNTYVDRGGSPLVDGVWFFKVRAIDDAGNVGPVAAYDELRVDTTSPTVPDVSSASHPTTGLYYSDPSLAVSWSSSDASSGVQDYRHELRTTSCPSALTTSTTTATSASFAGLGPFEYYYHCVQSRDNAGNWGPVAVHHFGVDEVAPEFEADTERPLDGETTGNLFASIRINYHDNDNDSNFGSAATQVNASAVSFFVDGIDIRQTWESQCGPGGALYNQVCRLEVTAEELVFEPPTPWSQGQHVVEVWIQDTVDGANTADTAWRFSVASTPADALPQETREGVCGLDRDLGKDLGCPPLSTESIRLPLNWLESFEFVQLSGIATASGSDHDWDQDGIPDLLDPVNLPSEAQWHLASSDAVDVLQGLEPSGFLLLVEPGHQEAFALLANTTAGVETTTDSADLLARVEAAYGVETRNALARVLHADTTVHLRSVLPNTPVEDAALPWAGGSLPGDGTWFLVRSDATRSVELELGGNLVHVAPPLFSHPSEADANLRWEFLNPHQDQSICYDAATPTGASACRGNSEPGWIRAYSGQAAYALEALEAALHQGLVPLEYSPSASTHDVVEPWPLLSPLVSLLDWLGGGEDAQEPEEPSVDEFPGERVSPREALETFRLPERSLPTVFDEDAPWQILGDASRAFPDGVGVDYLFELEGLNPGQSLVTQARSLQDASEPDDPRAFHFQGSYTRIPAEPMDLTSLRFGVESIDGDHSGQAFLLDGRALAELLPLDGFDPVVEIDEGHAEGFDYTVQDVDGDGYDDVVVWVPHFSTATFEVTSADADSTAKFWDIEVTGEGKAWISDHSKNAVWRYKVGSNGPYLEKKTISGFGLDSLQGTLGLHAISDSEFWVGGENSGDDNNPKSAYIAHFKDGSFVSRHWISDSTAAVYDLWVNDAGTQGYAGGTQMGWYTFQSGSWVQSNAINSNCAVRDIKFDSTGKGYVGLTNDCTGFRDQDILYFDGSSFQNADGVTKETDIWDIEPGWEWAVGDDWVDASGEKQAGIYRRDPSITGSWFQAYSDSNLLIEDYRSLAVQPVVGTLWMVGDSGPYIDSMIYKWSGSNWETFQHVDPRIHDMEFGTQKFGLAMGRTEILVYAENQPPVINSASLSDTTPTTQQTVTATANAVDNDGDSLTYQWIWGDGFVRPFSTTSSASHAYDDVGSFMVRLTVSDGEDQDTWTDTVTVSPESISIGSTDWVTLSGSGARHHYKVLSSSNRHLEVTLSSCSNTRLLANTDAPVQSWQSTPAWPSQPQSTTLLAGPVEQGDTLYLAVERTAGGSDSCLLGVQAIAGPSAPVIESLPAVVGTGVDAVLGVRVDHLGGYDTRAHIQWGDGASEYTPASGYESPGVILGASHAYASRGTKTVTVTGLDEFGEAASSATSQSIRVLDPATAVVESASSIGFYDAELSGSVTDRGGATCGETKARYLVYQGADASGSPIKTSGWHSSVCNSVPSWTVSGLTSGTLHSYVLDIDNGAWTSTSDPVSFQTLPTTSTTSTIASPASVEAGSSAVFSFHHDPVESSDVRYHIDWGDGTTQIHPSSGYLSPSSPVSVSHTYDFPYGTVPVSVQVEITSGSRSSTTLESVTVGGASLVQSMSHEPKLGSATLTGGLTDAVVQDSATQARFTYYDSAIFDWVTGPWTTISDNDALPAWTPSGLNVNTVYEAHVEFQANNGDSSWKTLESWSFQANKKPSLTALETGSRDATYLGDVRFSVLYQDREGDAPSSIQVVLNGDAYDMHASFGDSLDYASGVTYHFVARAGELPAPGTFSPKFQAEDAYQSAVSKWGGPVTVSQASVATHTFEDDALGGTPQGFTKSNDPLNYWRVADTAEPGFPAYVSLSGHGKAAWFGHPPGANYEDPEGGVPRGSLYTRTYDLSTLEDPVLSFSSYYETEDLAATKDTKQVLIRSKDPQSTSWDTTWSPLHTIQGLDGGYKKWRSHAIDLAAYKDQVVQLEFRFDAVNSERNDYLGWLIDDIAIGHDADGDTLPDELERTRDDVRISRALGAVPVPDGSSVKSFLGRLDRPQANRTILDALVTHPNPSDLKVYLGSQSAYDGSTGSKMIYNGTGAGAVGCSHPSWYGYARNNDGLTVDVDGGDMSISIDLRKCGLEGRDFLKQTDWFLEVEDTQAGDQERATIESFQVHWSGRTHPLLSDTDDDGESDGEEANLDRDPLGQDADRDGIPEQWDNDETTPDWLPALAALVDNRPDGKHSFRVMVMDQMIPVTSVSFTLEDEGEPLGHYIGPGPAWIIDLEDNELPNKITFDWTDAEGGTGHLEVLLRNHEPSNAEDYEMYAAVMTYETPDGGSYGWDYDELETHLREAWIAHVTEQAILGAGDVKGLYDIAKGVSRGVNAAGPAGMVVSFSGWDKDFAVLSPGPVAKVIARDGDVVADGRYYIAPRELVPGFVLQGVSTQELEDAMDSAGNAVPDTSGALRWVHPVADGHVVINTLGNHVTDAWKWLDPDSSEKDWQDAVGTEYLVWSEEDLAGRVASGSGTQARLEARHCATSCRYDTGGLSLVQLQDGGDGLNGEHFSEGILQVPHGFLKAQWLDYEKAHNIADMDPIYWTLYDDRVTDAMNAQVTLHQFQQLAGENRLEAARGGYWFWDNGDQEVDCNDPNADTDVPRCSQFQVDMALQSKKFLNFYSGHEFQTLELDWLKNSGTGTSRSDATSAAGRVGIRDGWFLDPSKDTNQAFIEAMDTTLNGQSFSTYGAHSYAAYDWELGKSPTAAVYYKET